jgi:lipopolysaccharide export system permease protein
MIRLFVINKYISKELLKIIMNVSLIFFCLGFLMNLFEEINFFKDFDVKIDVPIFMSLLFVPSLFYNMFPFIILISGVYFFFKIKKSEELTAMQISGMSNFSVIIVPSVISVILGIIFITSINPISSFLLKKYETTKGSYARDQDYLASITSNGIFIKEKNEYKNNIIRAMSLKGNYLNQVSIYKFDQDNNFIERIEGGSAYIESFNWSLRNVNIINNRGELTSSNLENFLYSSMYDINKIKSLYSNLDTISFWNLQNEIKLLKERGYSTKDVEIKLHKSIAFPFFLLSMILLSAVFTLGTKSPENNWSYVFLAIISSVLIFFFNDFSAVLGETEKLPLEVSVWMPILIIFIFSTIGIIHANQR